MISKATLIVEAGRVKAAGDAARVQIAEGAHRIDVSGRTIVPGVVNAHGHLADTQGLRTGTELYTEENLLRQLGLYGRYGVTCC